MVDDDLKNLVDAALVNLGFNNRNDRSLKQEICKKEIKQENEKASNEQAREELIALYEIIIVQNNNLMKEICNYQKIMQSTICNLLENGLYIKTLKQVDNLMSLFTTEFSNTMALLMDFPEKNYQDLIQAIGKSNSLTSLEFYIVSSMKYLRLSMDQNVIQNLYKID
jgi:hypothetical protein